MEKSINGHLATKMIPIVPIRKAQLKKKKGILGEKLPSERKDCAWIKNSKWRRNWNQNLIELEKSLSCHVCHDVLKDITTVGL